MSFEGKSRASEGSNGLGLFGCTPNCVRAGITPMSALASSALGDVRV
jgi:hypothetical protein